MTKPARVYLPFDVAGLTLLGEAGEVRADLRQGFEADADDEEATYDALVAADEASADQLVVEVDAIVADRSPEGTVTIASVSADDVVAFYSELAWFGVQEIPRFLGRS